MLLQIKAEAFYQQKKAATASKALAERKAAGELKAVNSVLEVRACSLWWDQDVCVLLNWLGLPVGRLWGGGS